MRYFLLRVLSLACSIIPAASIAGGLESPHSPILPTVTIPTITPGLGLSIQGSALRGYNNNLNYASPSDAFIFGIIRLNPVNPGSVSFYTLSPPYAFALQVGLDYALADQGNILKLNYEHLFNRESTANNSDTYVSTSVLDPISTVVFGGTGSLDQKLDNISLFSEQHVLIGAKWETTFSGGLRFAHLVQELSTKELATIDTPATSTALTTSSTMQFNGVGPMAGLGALFHLNNSLLIGTQVEGALLLGLNKINNQIRTHIVVPPSTNSLAVYPFFNTNSYGTVPELAYSIYANYFYRFNNQAEMEIEIGWRMDQFFNLRTFNDFNSVINMVTAGNYVENIASAALNLIQSDDIGFSGPYLMTHIKF